MRLVPAGWLGPVAGVWASMAELATHRAEPRGDRLIKNLNNRLMERALGERKQGHAGVTGQEQGNLAGDDWRCHTMSEAQPRLSSTALLAHGGLLGRKLLNPARSVSCRTDGQIVEPYLNL